MKVRRRPWHPNRHTRGQTRFATTPDPTWTPATRARWEDVRRFAAAHPGTPGMGGWTVERVAPPAGPRVTLLVLLVGWPPLCALFIYGPGGWWRDLPILAVTAVGVWGMRCAYVMGDLDAPDLSWSLAVRVALGGLPPELADQAPELAELADDQAPEPEPTPAAAPTVPRLRLVRAGEDVA